MKINKFEINICEDCYQLKGEMCHNPECVFIRRTMEEVSAYLDMLLIRPIIDGEQIDFRETTCKNCINYDFSFENRGWCTFHSETVTASFACNDFIGNREPKDE